MTMAQQPTRNWVEVVANGSRLKYLGLTLLLAWHYCLWFVPDTFPDVFLLDDRITYSWLVALACTGVVGFGCVFALGRKRHLTPSPALVWAVSAAGALASMGFVFAITLEWPWLADYAFSGAVGACSGLLWVMWGERLAAQRAKFTIGRIAPTYGGFLLLALVLAYVIPGWGCPVFVALLPLGSGLLLWAAGRGRAQQGYPHLLPRATAKAGTFSILIVCSISFVASLVSYFAVAIVPWETLWGGTELSFTIGIALGAAAIVGVAALVHFWPEHFTVFRMFPWLLFLNVVACALILLTVNGDGLAFMIALGVSSVFEILLMMYMGSLTLRGYTAPGVAFGLSTGSIRLGICLGNSLSLVYERVPGLYDLAMPTTMAFLVVLAALLVPLVRQEFALNELVRPPQNTSELDTVIAHAAAEFKLSEREREIVAAIARGYTAAAVGEKLFISTHTVNTHIQHIYDKMGIHKRSELLNYLNKRD
ncbi:MAG: LuxR C-terminal-related transcriptional regulator [Propionibacteriaceae bacterium]|jgi:DNA-binding CsgD family transcriptional regulator|nr:LuxR C-terminal-related transcriptional regulator [Propionibacteriaceae bacterium]